MSMMMERLHSMLNTKGDTWKYDGECHISIRQLSTIGLVNLVCEGYTRSYSIDASSNEWIRDHMYHCPLIWLLVVHFVHMLEQLELWQILPIVYMLCVYSS